MIVWVLLACQQRDPVGFAGRPPDSEAPEVTGDSTPTESEPPPDSGSPSDSTDSTPDSDTADTAKPPDEHLPVLLIDTHGGTISDGTKIDATMEVIREHDGTLTDLDAAPRDWSGDIGIEIHGSSSAGDPKPSYRFETRDAKGEDLDVAFLDFPVDSDWVLVANYEDPTQLRNALAYALAREVREPLGRWEPRTQWAELYLDGVYVGLYLVTERVKRGEDRIDVDSPDETTKGDVTGGYIVKIDQCRNPCWTTPRGTGVSWTYPHDDDITPDQDAYLRRWWKDFEAAMASDSATDPKDGYPAWIDVDSFVDHFVVNELTHNVDAYRLSAYLYKDSLEDGGLLSFGPVWDFDRAFGNVSYCDCEKTSGFIIDDLAHCGESNEFPFWYSTLLADEPMQDRIRCRWEELRLGVFDDAAIDAVLDDLVAETAEAHPRDNAVWHTTGGLAGKVAEMKDWMHERNAWLDANIPGTCGP